MCLPPPVRSLHFSIEAFQWRIAVKAMLRGINEMLRVGWMPHQPSHAFDDVSTPVFDRVLVIVIPSHIVERVYFPLPEHLIMWHGNHDFLDPIPVVVGKRLPPLRSHAFEWVRDWVTVIAALHQPIDKVENLSLDDPDTSGITYQSSSHLFLSSLFCFLVLTNHLSHCG